jgi:predicted nucleic acid-binding protein
MYSTAMKSMTSKAFLDTNVIVYALVERASTQPDRRTRIAEDILTNGGTVSVQVLTEFTDVVSRKHGKSLGLVGEMLDGIQAICGPAIPLTKDTYESALEISKRHGFRIYDSLIIAAAVQAGCDTVFTEDMQLGQVIDGVRIENPFKAV